MLKLQGWDDPSVVEGKESYEDWVGVQGFGLVGDVSIFPHMDESWEPLVEEKKTDVKFKDVLPLREWQVFCVDGDTKSTFLYEGDH